MEKEKREKFSQICETWAVGSLSEWKREFLLLSALEKRWMRSNQPFLQARQPNDMPNPANTLLKEGIPYKTRLNQEC